MSKNSSKKRIIIAAVLFAMFLVGAIVSIVVVLAASTQSVTTNIKIAYIVDGVGAKVNSSYAIVPMKETEEINRVAMTSDGNTDLNFGVSQESTDALMTPNGELALNSDNQQIVFEYYFENTADAAFSIRLLNSPGKNSGTNIEEQTSNMEETYYVSATRLGVKEYRDTITETELNPQALTEVGSKVYVYISAKVANENRNAYYNGEFIWELKRQETININLNNGDTTSILKVIPNTIEGLESINMPSIAVPTKGDAAFAGYYIDDTKYITLDGTGAHVADLSAGSTLTAQWAAGLTISGITLTAVNDETALSEGVLNIPEGVKTVGDGTNTIETTATEVVIPNSVEEIAPNAFSGNTTLTTVAFAETAETQGYADGYSENGSKLKVIGSNAFLGCSDLQSIELPASLEKIDNNAFGECTNLLNLYISNITAYLRVDLGLGAINHPFYPGNGMNIGQTKIYLNGSLIEILEIPEDVTRIETQAFSWCASIRAVKFGSNVSYVCQGAFINQSVGIDAIYVDSIEQWFDIVEDMIKTMESQPFFWSGDGSGKLYVQNELITSIVIPEGVTRIPDYAFFLISENSINSVVIPSSVKEIGVHAFTTLFLTSAEFKNVSGWYVYDSSAAINGIAIKLFTNEDEYFKNADIIGINTARYWKCTA